MSYEKKVLFGRKLFSNKINRRGAINMIKNNRQDRHSYTFLIVENHITQANMLKKVIMDYNKEFVVYVVLDAEQAYEKAMHINIDCFFLEMDLKHTTGIGLAKKIRAVKQYAATPILFVTKVSDKIQQALREVHCYDYIIKPYSREIIIHNLDALRCGKNTKEKIYRIKSKNDVDILLKYSDILYVQSQGKDVEFVTKSASYLCRNKTMKELEVYLDGEFIRCHRGYLVNVSYITSIDLLNNYLRLGVTEEAIAIGRKYKGILKERFRL